MATIGARGLIRKPRRSPTGVNYLRDSGIAILKNYYTQIDCIIYELAAYELVVSARTCTQPKLELATVRVCCGELPAPISGRRRCIWGSWHLQTVHTSDHCESGGARQTTLLNLNSHTACALRSSVLPCMWHGVIRAASWSPVYAPCSRGIPVQKTVPQCHETMRGRLTWQCYRTQIIGLAGVVLVQSTTEAPAVSDLHKQK